MKINLKHLSLTAIFIAFPLLASSLQNKLEQCTAIENNSSRLACFDALSIQNNKMEDYPRLANTNTPETSPIKTTPAKNIASTYDENAKQAQKAEQFGAEHFKKKPSYEDDSSIVFVVKSLKKDPYGKWRFTFENGQKWKQSDSAHFNVKAGNEVLLTKGMMGAIYLKKNTPNNHKKIRVKRLK